ncbi:MAG: hypothetical protein LBH56_02890 [Coriobacteriales bacterium]|jgi:hypothetical protein|nr:hypothetical protein [Coriobacteriales bacterium]
MKNMHTRNAIVAFIVAVVVFVVTVYMYLNGYVWVLFRVIEIPLPIAWIGSALLVVYAIYELVTGPKKDAALRKIREEQQAAQQLQAQFLAPCVVTVTRHADKNTGAYSLEVLCNGMEAGKVSGGKPLVFSTPVAENDLTVIYPSLSLEETLHFSAFDGGSVAFFVSSDGKAVFIEDADAPLEQVQMQQA